MNIQVAKNAGFCFGVRRAVDLVYRLLSEGKRVCTLGPIIHNPSVIRDLSDKGVSIVNIPEETPDGAVLVIRSHGVPKSVMDTIERLGLEYADATCPFVKKIHTIVEKAHADNRPVIIAGDALHPEVKGINGYCDNGAFVFNNMEKLANNMDSWYNQFNIDGNKTRENLHDQSPVMVAQTTFNKNLWENCVFSIKKVYTNVEIFDTICNATFERQSEAEQIAARSSLMLVIGGKESSNTCKLRDICAKYCHTVLVENAGELHGLADMLRTAHSIGVTAGASTPACTIKEVLDTMSEIIETNQNPEEQVAVSATQPPQTEEVATAENAVNDESVAAEPPAQVVEEKTEKSFDEMTYEEAFEASLNNMNSDQRVKGYVLAITPTEIQVDIGRKYAGFVPRDEFSADPNEKPEDSVKIGDTLDLIVMRTNDQEGTVMLSKRRFEALKNWDAICAAVDTEETLEGKVIEIIKGGLLLVSGGVRVFIPASHATLTRGEPLDDLLHKRVNFRVIEVNRNRHRAVGSIRLTLRDQRREMQASFWQEIEVDKQYTGKVKSLTSYGAFVDLGGVDGMVHVSELSWQRIKDPSEVVNVGDVITVYVKSYDPEKKRISLRYKKDEDNPWSIFLRDFNIDDVIKVSIVSLTSYGAFANIIPGVDGLIHISQIADRRIETPQDVLSVGQEVDVKITAVDTEKKRISLSIRALLEPMMPMSTDEDEIVASTDDMVSDSTTTETDSE